MIFKKIILISLFFCFLNAQDNIVIGLLYNNIFEDKSSAKVSIKVFLKQVRKKDYGKDFNILYYDDEKKILKDFIDKKITNMVIDSAFYFRNKSQIDKYKDFVWGLSQTNEIFDQYYLIENEKANLSLNSKQLKTIYFNDESQRKWLEFLVLKNKEYLNKSVILNKFEKQQKANKNLLEVFFHNNKISVVSKDVFDSMIKINPQIKKQIKIIKKSPKIFLSALGVTRKGLSKSFENASSLMEKDYVNKTSKTEVFAFANIKRVYYFFDDDTKELKQLNKFYKEYFKLKK